MQMARSIDSDYIDLSLMGGFDMGINFDGFEENVKKIMELPIKYLDSAHGKAVDLIEDVHAMLWAPSPDGEVSNRLSEIFKDPSSSSVTGSLPTSVGTNAEVSNPPSLITMENSFAGYIDMDAYETESVLAKNGENGSSKGDNVEANDMCLLPENTLTTELCDSTTSEEIILWSPEQSAKPPQSSEPTTISKYDYVPHALELDTVKVTQQVGLHCSGHPDIPLECSSANYEEHIVLHSAKDHVEAAAHETNADELSTDVSKCACDSTMYPDDTENFVSICLGNSQENMKSDEFEASYVCVRQNTSFKKMFMRKLSNKLGWSKNKTNVQQVVSSATRSEDAENNLGFQLVSSSDDLDDDWEIL